MACAAGAETNKIPAWPRVARVHAYIYTMIEFACHKPTILAISLITVTSTMESFIIEP